MPFFDSGVAYDSGARFDAAPPTPAPRKKHMAKVKLELKLKSDSQLSVFCTAHKMAMVGNANFPTPNPTALSYDAVLADYNTKLATAEDAQQAAKEATALKEAARAALETATTNRGNYVDEVADGSEAIILSAAFDVRAVPAPIGQLPAPENFMPTMGDMPGEIDLSWSAVRGANSYVIEWREQGTTGPWTQEFATKSKHEVHGLVSGKTYVFRVLAIGAAGKGPWSLEAARMAP